MPRRPTGTRAAEPQKTPFLIVTTSSAKLDPAARKQVRSHVMRGKNRKQRQPHDGTAPGSWINGREEKAISWKIPPRVGNDMTHIPFAEQMQPYMLELTFKWFTILKQAMYPVELCVQPGDGQWVEYLAYDAAYVHSIICATQSFFDFVGQARFGEKAIHHLNRSLHTLRQNLADNQLATSDSTISTVITLALLSDVMGDATAATNHMQGLYQLVNIRGGIPGLRHNSELQSKVLRADLSVAISTGSKTLFFTEGFSWEPYLIPHTTKPTLHIDNNAPSITHNPPSPTKHALHPLHQGVHDPRLLNTLLDLQEFSRAANLAFQTGRKIPADLFRETLVSAQYRLLALRDEDDAQILHRQQRQQQQQQQQQEPLPSYGGQSERHREPDRDGELGGKGERVWDVIGFDVERLLRLGMLAFTTTTFLKIKQMPMPYADLAGRMREFVRDLSEQEQVEECSLQIRRLTLWFLFVARTSVLDGKEDEEMLVDAAERAMAALGLAEAGWEEIRDVLRGVMWIDLVHAEGGREFWGRVNAGRGV